MSKTVITGGAIAIFLIAAVVEHFIDGGQEAPKSKPVSSAPETPPPPPNPIAKPKSSPPNQTNGYEQLLGVRLKDHRNNDGDSFFVKYSDREFELRLYFADCAEKYYSDKYEDQRERVRDQAKDFGGLSVEETTKLGEVAKRYVAGLLKEREFTVYTDWERVYGGERFHGFVEINDPDAKSESIYLSELLVREGLARIHTGGAKSPDGRSERAFRDRLDQLESKAKREKSGAWGL